MEVAIVTGAASELGRALSELRPPYASDPELTLSGAPLEIGRTAADLASSQLDWDRQGAY